MSHKALLLGCSLAGTGAAQAAIRVEPASCLQRIPPLAADVSESVFAKRAELSLARNEYEALQIVLLAEGEAGRDISVTVTDLKRQPVRGERRNRVSANDVIPATNVSVRREEYINGSYKRPIPAWDASFYEDPSAKNGRLSSWPELLREIEAPFDVAAGAAQPLWVQVYVPRKTRPGTFSGEIRVRAKGQAAKVLPFTVRVWDFELPKETHLRSTFHIWDEGLMKYHNSTDIRDPRYQKIRLAYVDFYLQHRVSPFTPANYPVDMKFVRKASGEIDIDFTEFDRQMQRAFDNGLNAFQWPGQVMMYPEHHARYTGGPYIWDEVQKKYVWVEMNENWGKPDAAQRAQLEKLTRKIAQHLQQKGWLNKSVAYMVGEPFKGHDEHVPGLDDFEYARQVFKWLHGINPGIRNMTAMLHDIYTPEIGGDVDVWAGDTSAAFKFITREQTEMAKGREIWTYLPGLYRIDSMAAAYRISPWYCFKYGIKGMGPYTDITAWTTNNAHPLTAEAHQAETIPDDWIIYPGKDGPIDTIRFNLLRDGLEDYEYLLRLKQLTAKLKAKHPFSPLLSRAEKLLTADSIIRERDPFEKGNWDYSPEGILKARLEIGNLCQSIGEVLK